MHAIKIVVVGDGCSGKTFLLRCYCTNSWIDDWLPTGYDIYSVDVVINERRVKLEIHDTSGRDDYERLQPIVYQDTDVFLVCFSLENSGFYKDTIGNIQYKWIPQIRRYSSNTPTVLVGTKMDLRETCIEAEKRKSEFISYKQGRSLAKEIDAVKYVECSAKTKDGVESVFEEAVRAVLNQEKSPVYGTIQTIFNRIRLNAGVQQQDRENPLSAIKDETTFKSLLSYGEYESYGNRIYLAGACNVGKSTLASLLIGDKIPLKWKSTDGLRIYFGRNGIDVKNRKMVPLKKSKRKRVLSNVLYGLPDMKQEESEKEASLNQEESEKGASVLEVKHSDDTDDLGSPKPEQTSSGIGPSLTSLQENPHARHKHKPQKILGVSKLEFKSIHKDIKSELKRGKYKVDIAPSDLLDFGGQRSYDMTHQLFIQGKGTFTLIFDGRKGLQDILEEYPEGNITTESILKHWVDSILTYCGVDDGDVLPVILFVATHRDYFTYKDEESKRMAEVKEGLKEMFQNHERRDRIRYDNIFFINGTDINDPEVIRLQAVYVDIAFQQKSWGKRMPMAWVPLELQISEMIENNISIISKKELEDLNRLNDDLALDQDQFELFLKYQHSLGKVMYFEAQGLGKYIILQPASLVDILRSFITDEIFFPSSKSRNKMLVEMTKTGMIYKTDLFQLWSKDKCNLYMPNDDIKEFVAKVLVHLDLLVEPKSDEAQSHFFLVPCMVKQKPTPDFIRDIRSDKTLYMSYKLSKSSIPSALSFKLIGAILNVWPLKETHKGICLYHKAAILHINKDNELRILGEDDRIIVCLVNTTAKEFISPDIASCVQECLTQAMRTALEFYHNSFGMIVSNSDISNMLQIELGEKCEIDICYISLTDAKTRPSWNCAAAKEHKTEKILYWNYDKDQKDCPPNCTGLDKKTFQLCPEDKHLARLALRIDIDKFHEFIIRLGLSEADWNSIEYRHYKCDVKMMKIDALYEWKKTIKHPSFQCLHDAVTGIENNCHVLCQIFREDTTLLAVENTVLQREPDNDTLYELSRKIGHCAMHLGVELGLETAEIENSIFKHSKDIFDQNYDILTKWRNAGSKKTLRSLMQALLQIADLRGTRFLDKAFTIGIYKQE